jgi:GntR family transcriptional regulator, N-acetylglucosamine utilization regulator
MAQKIANPSQVFPLYAQLKERIIDLIADRVYAPGDQLPSQRELIDEFGASHMTVRRAINELIQEGVIHAIPGKGIFVSQPKQQAEPIPLRGFTEEMGRRGMKASSRILAAEIISASTMLARVFETEVGTPLIYLRRLRLANLEPIAIQAAYLCHEFCPGLLDHDLEEGSLYDLLHNEFGLAFGRANYSFEAVLADEEQAALLNAAMPLALLVSEQLTFLENDVPIEFVRSVYRGDRYRIGQ